MTERVFAPAKINLTLQVGRPRKTGGDDDGLHPLQSVVAFADVGDSLSAAPAPALSLDVVGPFAAALAGENDNLVLRAARALQQAGVAPKVGEGAALTLDKRLPVASGIGGGSSDAAATLQALNRLWGINLSAAELMRFARDLGADVPVCITARAAYMTGAGADVMALSLPVLDAVLVNPLKPLATGAVYRAFDALGLGDSFVSAPAPRWNNRDEAIAAIAAMGNDLFPAAASILPAVSEIAGLLRADPRVRVASLSGSGATFFALVDNPEQAAALAADVRLHRPDWWVVRTRLV